MNFPEKSLTLLVCPFQLTDSSTWYSIITYRMRPRNIQTTYFNQSKNSVVFNSNERTTSVSPSLTWCSLLGKSSPRIARNSSLYPPTMSISRSSCDVPMVINNLIIMNWINNSISYSTHSLQYRNFPKKDIGEKFIFQKFFALWW